MKPDGDYAYDQSNTNSIRMSPNSARGFGSSLTAVHPSPMACPTDLQYAELCFDQQRQQQNMQPDGRVPMSSASMHTLFDRPSGSAGSNYKHPIGSSVPQGLNSELTRPMTHPTQIMPVDESSSHYTEIVGFMQPPKAYESQLVLEQQQEAVHALLAMNQNKSRVFV